MARYLTFMIVRMRAGGILYPRAYVLVRKMDPVVASRPAQQPLAPGNDSPIWPLKRRWAVPSSGLFRDGGLITTARQPV